MVPIVFITSQAEREFHAAYRAGWITYREMNDASGLGIPPSDTATGGVTVREMLRAVRLGLSFVA